MEWREPWWSTASQDAKFHSIFHRELKLELGPKHPLFNVPVQMIGRKGDSDDTLFELLDGSGRVAVVHLTWAQRPEPMPWPGTVLFESLETWAEQCMKPQHEEFRSLQES